MKNMEEKQNIWIHFHAAYGSSIELQAEALLYITIRDNVTATDENIKDKDILYLITSFLYLIDNKTRI